MPEIALAVATDIVAPTCLCGSPMKLFNGKFRKFWGCVRYPICDGRVGAHQSDGRPLGTPIDAEGRELRIQAHAAFDGYWRNAGIERQQAYTWLAGKLGISEEDCHIGLFDKATCKKVIGLALMAAMQ